MDADENRRATTEELKEIEKSQFAVDPAQGCLRSNTKNLTIIHTLGRPTVSPIRQQLIPTQDTPTMATSRSLKMMTQFTTIK